MCISLILGTLLKISADDILKYFSYFSQTVCMKCQIQFSGNKKKNVISVSSAEFAKRMVKLNEQFVFVVPKSINKFYFQCI